MDLNLISLLLVNTEYWIGDRHRLFEVQIYQISVELKKIIIGTPLDTLAASIVAK